MVVVSSPTVVVSSSVVVSTTAIVSTVEDVLNGPGVEIATIGDTVNMIWNEVVVVVEVDVVEGVVNLLGTPVGNVMSTVGLELGLISLDDDEVASGSVTNSGSSELIVEGVVNLVGTPEGNVMSTVGLGLG